MNKQINDKDNDWKVRAHEIIKSLETDYVALDACHTILSSRLAILRSEEENLRAALREASESGKEKLLRERKEKDFIALKKLESALFCEDDDDDSDTSMASLKAERLVDKVDVNVNAHNFSSSDEDIDEEELLRFV